MIRRLLRWLIPDEALRSIGRVHYRRHDGIAVVSDPRMDRERVAFVGVPVVSNSYVPEGQVLGMRDTVDGSRKLFANPADVERIFGGVYPWRGAPW